MKALLIPAIALVLVLIPLFLTNQALAQVQGATEDDTIGFYNARTDTVLVTMVFPQDSARDARLLANAMGPESASENMEIAIVKSVRLDREMKDVLGASGGWLMGGVWLETMEPMTLLVMAVDDDLYVSMMIGEGLDGNAFALYTMDLAEDGLDAEPPRGFRKVNMDDRI